ncbi:hypothetical protein V6N12_012945 [Hibiscus sabdariffa]|uniref:RNase H type-1 domain-containing protein n=1 Tax=Hibiscus sabdariffa TaxID=183260 RepID=A0ABR2EJL9_9ROSI
MGRRGVSRKLDTWISVLELCSVGDVGQGQGQGESERGRFGDSDALAGNALIDSLHGLLSRQWLICIHYISCEINGVTDGLAITSRDVSIAILEFPSISTKLVDREALSD